MTVAELTKGLNGYMKDNGYKKKGNSFYKIENDFVRVINVYKGRYFNDFYINLGIEPYKYPKFYTTKELILEEFPDEAGCVFRESIINPETRRREFPIGENILDVVIREIENQAEVWFTERDSYEKITKMKEDDLVVSGTPIYKVKRKYMLLFYCYLKLKNYSCSRMFLKEYLKISTGNDDFSAVDNYLIELFRKTGEVPDFA